MVLIPSSTFSRSPRLQRSSSTGGAVFAAIVRALNKASHLHYSTGPFGGAPALHWQDFARDVSAAWAFRVDLGDTAPPITMVGLEGLVGYLQLFSDSADRWISTSKKAT